LSAKFVHFYLLPFFFSLSATVIWMLAEGVVYVLEALCREFSSSLVVGSVRYVYVAGA